ncbi:hypothetical protein NC652_013929 [Populus alba x Populus x berolinensis]|nr:hypothetical protein NC652_013929 [Populus alba x Populus x berolinensis]
MAPSHQISMPLTNLVGCYFGVSSRILL